MLGSLDHLTRQLIVHTSQDQRSSDFIAHLSNSTVSLDRSPGDRPAGRARRGQWSDPHQQTLARCPCRPRTLAHRRVAADTPPNSMKSSPSGAILRPITSPTRPSQMSPHSTKPSMTPSSISTASAPSIRWRSQESLLSPNHAITGRFGDVGPRIEDQAAKRPDGQVDQRQVRVADDLARFVARIARRLERQIVQNRLDKNMQAQAFEAGWITDLDQRVRRLRVLVARAVDDTARRTAIFDSKTRRDPGQNGFKAVRK